jgi:hypothetical protein
MKLRLVSAVIGVALVGAALVHSTRGEARAPRPGDVASRSVLSYLPLGTSLWCLNSAALRLLDRIEAEFGPVEIISTCRPGAIIAGSNRPSHHGTGNAIDFNAGERKAAILKWLIANHRQGGTMTYADMDHIHVDIGRHFVSLAASSGRSRGGRGSQNSPLQVTTSDWQRGALGARN